MRVLFDHQIYSYQTFGGISRYFFELMNQFQTFGNAEFDLALRYSDNVYLKSLAGVRLHAAPAALQAGSKARFLATYLLNRRLSVRRLRAGEFDVFHPTFFDRYFVSKLGKKPFVMTLMDMTPELFPELFPRTSLYSRLVTSRWIDAKRDLAQRASRIIAISQNTKQDAVRLYGIEPGKIEVIHLASSMLPPSASAKWPPTAKRRFVLFVGSRFGYKNFDFFARAMQPVLARDGDLRVICAGGGRFTADERGTLGTIGQIDRFEQMDVADERLAGLYATARAFVFPSRYEGFGIPILEAFACGCPCVLSNTSCFPEIAGDAASFFDLEEESSLTAAIERVLGDDGHRSRLIERGRERAKLFAWRKTALQTLAVYNNALA